MLLSIYKQKLSLYIYIYPIIIKNDHKLGTTQTLGILVLLLDVLHV